PPAAVAIVLDSWQLANKPCTQKTHSPHAILNGTNTLSPTFKLVTPLPSSRTIPMNSCPNVLPTRVSGTIPWYKCKSEPHIQAQTYTYTTVWFQIHVWEVHLDMS